MPNKNATVDLASLPPVITVTEAAAIARVCPKHMRELLREGTIQGAKLGTCWRVNRDALLAHLGLKGQAIA